MLNHNCLLQMEPLSTPWPTIDSTALHEDAHWSMSPQICLSATCHTTVTLFNVHTSFSHSNFVIRQLDGKWRKLILFSWSSRSNQNKYFQLSFCHGKVAFTNKTVCCIHLPKLPFVIKLDKQIPQWHSFGVCSFCDPLTLKDNYSDSINNKV